MQTLKCSKTIFQILTLLIILCDETTYLYVLADNIKTSRTSVRLEVINNVFNNIKRILENANPKHVYKCNKTNVTGDPDAKKVAVQRRLKRAGKVQDHLKQLISIMVCGNADGKEL